MNPNSMSVSARQNRQQILNPSVTVCSPTVYSWRMIASCLAVAEKVIGCLNDGKILHRYQAIKTCISDLRAPQLSPHLKLIAFEKRELTTS
jgi:hypothetical protein